MRRVSPREALALMEQEGFAYLDVRSVPEFEQGHPAGAYNVPWLEPGEAGMTPNAHFVAEVSAVLAAELPVVVGCASGVRSLEAAKCLEMQGYTHIVEQRAGHLGVRDAFGRTLERGWQDEGLPVSVQPEPGRSHRQIRGGR